jgi:glutamate racemase
VTGDVTSDAPVSVGVFDAGIGGLPVAARLAECGVRIVYLGDSGRRPYGPQPNEVVASYVAEAEQFFADAGCDLWIIACNTASVVAAGVLRGLLPCIDMVSAVRHRYPPGGSGTLGLLATAGTVSSGVFPDLLAGYDLHQLATEELLRIAEEGGSERERVRALAADALDALRAEGCAEVILACTDFTCVLDELAAEAGGLVLFDPLDAVLELADERMRALGHRAAQGPAGHRLVLTGPHPVDVAAYALSEFGLALPGPEFITLEPARLAPRW